MSQTSPIDLEMQFTKKASWKTRKPFFNYDFKFNDFPYLSDIVLEIFKRKQPNPDADISDLLQKLWYEKTYF